MSSQALTINFSDASFNSEFEGANTEIFEQSSAHIPPSDIRPEQLPQYNETESPSSFVPVPAYNDTRTMQTSPFQMSFVAEQEWEGFVLEINGEDITAHLIDLSQTGVEERVEFSLNEVSDIHKELVKEGAIFRWSIGYERVRGGTKRKVSSIIFRRLPAWTKRDLSKSASEVESFQQNIIWE